MIEVTREQWRKIHRDYKGRWTREDYPEYIGKRSVLSGCISNVLGHLYIEGRDFIIVKDKP